MTNNEFLSYCKQAERMTEVLNEQKVTLIKVAQNVEFILDEYNVSVKRGDRSGFFIEFNLRLNSNSPFGMSMDLIRRMVFKGVPVSLPWNTKLNYDETQLDVNLLDGRWFIGDLDNRIEKLLWADTEDEYEHFKVGIYMPLNVNAEFSHLKRSIDAATKVVYNLISHIRLESSTEFDFLTHYTKTIGFTMARWFKPFNLFLKTGESKRVLCYGFITPKRLTDKEHDDFVDKIKLIEAELKRHVAPVSIDDNYGFSIPHIPVNKDDHFLFIRYTMPDRENANYMHISHFSYVLLNTIEQVLDNAYTQDLSKQYMVYEGSFKV